MRRPPCSADLGAPDAFLQELPSFGSPEADYAHQICSTLSDGGGPLEIDPAHFPAAPLNGRHCYAALLPSTWRASLSRVW